MKDGRLRPEWRIIVALVFTSIIAGLLFLVFWGTMTAVVEVPTDLTGEQTEEFLVKGMEEVVDGSGWLKLIQRLIPSLALILGILLALRLLDKKKLADIGVGPLLEHRGEFAYGLALGAVSMAVVFAALLASDSITLENGLADPRFSWNLVAGAVLFIFVGFTEELYSRAYSISTLPSTLKLGTRSFMRFRVLRKVDLPQPEGPISAVTLLASMEMDMSARAWKDP